MSITFSCGNCGKAFRVAAELAGKKGKCKQCGSVIAIPAVAAHGSREAAPPRPQTRAQPRPTLPPEPVDDPYGLEEKAVSTVKPHMPAENDFPPMADPRTRGSKSPGNQASSQGSSYALFDVVPGKFYLNLLVVLAILGVWSLIHSSGLVLLLWALGLVAVGLIFYGQIGALVTPFHESLACGLMYLFLPPFYPLYYLVSRWHTMAGSFLNFMAGSGIMIGFIVLAATTAG